MRAHADQFLAGIAILGKICRKDAGDVSAVIGAGNAITAFSFQPVIDDRIPVMRYLDQRADDFPLDVARILAA